MFHLCQKVQVVHHHHYDVVVTGRERRGSGNRREEGEGGSGGQGGRSGLAAAANDGIDEHRRGRSCGKTGKGISVVSKGERGTSVGVERRKRQPIAAKDMLVIPTQPISSTENIFPFTPLHPPHSNNQNTPTGRAHLLRFNHLNRAPALFQPTPLPPPPTISPLALTASLHLPAHPSHPPLSPFASDRIYQTIKKSPRIHFSHDTNDKTASNSSSQIWKDCSA